PRAVLEYAAVHLLGGAEVLEPAERDERYGVREFTRADIHAGRRASCDFAAAARVIPDYGTNRVPPLVLASSAVARVHDPDDGHQQRPVVHEHERHRRPGSELRQVDSI